MAVAVTRITADTRTWHGKIRVGKKEEKKTRGKDKFIGEGKKHLTPPPQNLHANEATRSGLSLSVDTRPDEVSIYSWRPSLFSQTHYWYSAKCKSAGNTADSKIKISASFLKLPTRNSFSYTSKSLTATSVKSSHNSDFYRSSYKRFSLKMFNRKKTIDLTYKKPVRTFSLLSPYLVLH